MHGHQHAAWRRGRSRGATTPICGRYGLTATQLSLLGAIGTLPGATVSELAEARGFERTTLTRNLDRLEAMGLVAPRPRQGQRRASREITPKGRALIDELLPLWRQAQAEHAQRSCHPRRIRRGAWTR